MPTWLSVELAVLTLVIPMVIALGGALVRQVKVNERQRAKQESLELQLGHAVKNIDDLNRRYEGHVNNGIEFRRAFDRFEARTGERLDTIARMLESKVFPSRSD